MNIGGYIELDLPDAGTQLHPTAIALQSARACLYSYLKIARPNTVHLPDFICDSIFPSIDRLGIERKSYTLNEEMLPDAESLLPDGDILLVVNYFGLLSEKVRKFASLFNQDSLIIDNSQALFSPPIPGLVSLYSPRKFIGIPDGGYLYSSVSSGVPSETFPGEQHMAHLVLRASGRTEAGYRHYLDAEEALADIEPRKMSAVSQRLVRSIDFARVEDTRRQNFAFLHSGFHADNALDLKLNEDVPLCYPLMLGSNVGKIRDLLMHKGIFLPTYWPNCLETKLCNMSHALVHQTLYLPVNQSLRPAEMDLLMHEVRRLL